MKIATFNIWNSDRGMPLREKQIIREVQGVDADIICLQEVREEIYDKLCSELGQYKYSHYHNSYPGYDRLAIFSKHPLLNATNMKCAVVTTCKTPDYLFLVVNVHLPSESILQQEQCIADIFKDIADIQVDYAFLTGDFNNSGESSVHHFITGQRTLMGLEANPEWYDLAEVHAQLTNTKLENTLDLLTNPRWKGKDYAVTSCRVDKIYLRSAFPNPYPELKSFSLFAKTIDEESGYCASDHYGVVGEIKID